MAPRAFSAARAFAMALAGLRAWMLEAEGAFGRIAGARERAHGHEMALRGSQLLD